MKVAIGTIDVSDDMRRAIADLLGKKGLATREDVRMCYQRIADADLLTILSEYETSQQATKDHP